MKRAAAAVAVVLTLGAALTGCVRFGEDRTAPTAPSPTVMATDAPTDDVSVGDVLEELDDVDAALTQAEIDAAAGDDAARTDDAP